MRHICHIVVVACVCLVAAACATSRFEKSVQLKGKSVSEAVALLGMPNDERTILGKKVYTWVSSSIDKGTEYKCQIRAITANNIVESVEISGSSCVFMT